MNQQAKQFNLFGVDGVKYTLNYTMNSPLYLGQGASGDAFQKLNPSLEYQIKNSKENNLGRALPQGVMRVYGNSAFLGEADVSGFAEGENIKITVGKSFDIYAKGSIQNIRRLSADVIESNVKIDFYNSKDKEVVVEFIQDIAGTWEMVSESVKSERKNNSQAVWKIKVPAEGMASLLFNVRVNK